MKQHHVLACVLALGLLWTQGVAAQPASASTVAPPSPPPDARFKADILVIVAHPDDEMMAATWLAKASLDQRRRVAVVFMTRGNAGGNLVGYEQGASLAKIREIEARRALGLLDIDHVWFLDAPDTPAPDGHDVLRSLAAWDHGARLAELVRFIRLTRPAVVLTLLPDVVVGENHEDHQAAGVIATEAFDLAGDPTRFPEQVAFPADRLGFAQLPEGLRPWQPQKLYYFSDADNQEFLAGHGPAYPVKALSTSTQRAYFRYWMAMAHEHRTQYDGIPSPDTAEPAGFDPPPRRFVLGKSLVDATVEGDILQGIRPDPISFAPVRGYQPAAAPGVSLQLGGTWHFYREFWQAHGLDRMAQLQPTPVSRMTPGGALTVPLLIRNDTDTDSMVTIGVNAPAGWTATQRFSTYPVRAHDVYPASVTLSAPAAPFSGQQDLRFTLQSGGKDVASTELRVHVR